MMQRNRIQPVLTFAAVAMALLVLPAAADQLPDPDTDYEKLTPKNSKTVIYDGMGTDPFPKVDGEATYVARGFIEVKTSGTYVFSPGYQASTYNIMELEGREVYRTEPGGEPVQVPTKMIGGKRYPFKVTFLTKAANGLFWVGRTDIPGTVKTVDSRDFWRRAEESPSGQGYHYNRNAKSYVLVGEALGRGMIELLTGK